MVQASPRPGNSRGRRPAGSDPALLGAVRRPRASAPRGAAGGQAPHPGLELGPVELADARRLQEPAGVGVDEGGTAADPVEGRDGAVVVVADRHRPAPIADQVANFAAAVADVDREEVHAPTVTLRHLADHVLLDLAVPAAAEPERDHQRPVEVVADPNHVAPPHLTGGVRRGPRDAGSESLSQSSWAMFASPSRRRSRPGRRTLPAARRSSTSCRPRMPWSRLVTVGSWRSRSGPGRTTRRRSSSRARVEAPGPIVRRPRSPVESRSSSPSHYNLTSPSPRNRRLRRLCSTPSPTGSCQPPPPRQRQAAPMRSPTRPRPGPPAAPA